MFQLFLFSFPLSFYRSVKVILHSIEKVDVTLIVSYVVKNASWSPIYDIRVFTKDKTRKKEEGADGIFQSTVHPEAVNGVMEFMTRFEEKMSSLDERYLELSTQKKKMEEELKVLTTKLDNLNSSYQGKERVRLDYSIIIS
ncbi:PREDICTED: uncharacterized protein LOC109590953 [Amphimedon queenslandica]|uniref:Uncharacterized protein n=2 Tax=Amphimedon queenslandica TaxID=400682 RepID=A0AAN0JYP5_AMPQE|nr:PREDICTED: uncharacterized protein LOC109590953 [Amphimedon queenslandica]|eukprot:XP_019862347.1 PREDICTED: uncharacterized protein LOC109590953 [Amphimedon queenslandica]